MTSRRNNSFRLESPEKTLIFNYTRRCQHHRRRRCPPARQLFYCPAACLLSPHVADRLAYLSLSLCRRVCVHLSALSLSPDIFCGLRACAISRQASLASRRPDRGRVLVRQDLSLASVYLVFLRIFRASRIYWPGHLPESSGRSPDGFGQGLDTRRFLPRRANTFPGLARHTRVVVCVTCARALSSLPRYRLDFFYPARASGVSILWHVRASAPLSGYLEPRPSPNRESNQTDSGFRFSFRRRASARERRDVHVCVILSN